MIFLDIMLAMACVFIVGVFFYLFGKMDEHTLRNKKK